MFYSHAPWINNYALWCQVSSCGNTLHIYFHTQNTKNFPIQQKSYHSGDNSLLFNRKSVNFLCNSVNYIDLCFENFKTQIKKIIKINIYISPYPGSFEVCTDLIILSLHVTKPRKFVHIIIHNLYFEPKRVAQKKMLLAILTFPQTQRHTAQHKGQCALLTKWLMKGNKCEFMVQLNCLFSFFFFFGEESWHGVYVRVNVFSRWLIT